MKIPFVGQAYESNVIPLNSQRCINWFFEPEPVEARSQSSLQAVSGTADYISVEAGPIRGLWFAELMGFVFFVSGSRLYKVDSSDNVTSLGNIDGDGLVSMADNGTQVALATGSSAYIYDEAQGLTLEADVGAVKDVVYQDGFFIFVNTEGQEFKVTAINDGRVFDPLDFAETKSTPDSLVAVVRSKRRLWFMGANGYEIWANSGAPDFPFTRIDGASFDGYGLAGTFGIVVADSRPYWCSNDGRIYRGNGYAPERISHYGIENSLRTYSTLEDVEASAWTENGHRFIAFSFPSGGETWVFDSSSNMWHQRSSGVHERIWSGRFSVQAFGSNIVGDRSQGRLGKLDLDLFTEYGETMRARRSTPVIHANQAPIFYDRLEILMEVGRADASEDPQIRLSYSDNGGVTYNNPEWKSIGQAGEYQQRQVFWRQGQSINRTYNLEITDTVRRNIIDCVVEGEDGEI